MNNYSSRLRDKNNDTLDI